MDRSRVSNRPMTPSTGTVDTVMRYEALRRLLSWLIVGAALLVSAYLVTQGLKFRYGYNYQQGFERLLNLDGEANVPAWYSSMLLLVSAVLSTLIWRSRRDLREPDAKYWLGLGLVFVYLSMDEAALIHETIIEPQVRLWLPMVPTTGYLYYPWIIAGGLFVMIFGLAYAGFVLRLPTAVRSRVVLAGCFFVGGAIGVEALSAHHDDLYGWNTFSYAAFVALEEGLEMAGVLVFLSAQLSYWLRPVSEASPSIASAAVRRALAANASR